MRDLTELDHEFLDELSKRAVEDFHVQLLLEIIAELNAALHEKREIRVTYHPMLALTMAAHGASQVDAIRFVSGVSSLRQGEAEI